MKSESAAAPARATPDARERFRPIAFPDVVECGLRVTDIGTSSMRFEVGLSRNEEPLAAARAYYVQVCCDRETQRPIPMPAPVRAALEALQVSGKR